MQDINPLICWSMYCHNGDMILTETQFIDMLDRHIMVFKYADSGSLQSMVTKILNISLCFYQYIDVILVIMKLRNELNLNLA